ncbi:MAG: DNA repair ATPase [Myxococcales bacterium]|nr:DNA repair ATPase [Myxococcales bacterium]
MTAEESEPRKSAIDTAVDKGTYEVLRDRLVKSSADLANRADRLNVSRVEHFGTSRFEVISSDRIRTINNCVPRDIVSVGNHLIFGYNVFIGLRKQTVISDVLSVHRFQDEEGKFSFEPLTSGHEPDYLVDPRFVRDFDELYQYYKDAKLVQLRVRDQKLLAVFQIGQSIKDIRVLRWSIANDFRLNYIDNRGERDHIFPPTHDFEWTATTRSDHRHGSHPHVSILDEVFVETIGGDLTVKIEDNTATGLGVYSEPVDDPRQSLDDAEFLYARVGPLVLLKIKPYRELSYRYLVFNTRTRTVSRIDAIGQSCVRLPEDHGIIFPGGYYLQNGELKLFDLDISGMIFKRMVRSPNGEDVLYVFHDKDGGRRILLPYNLIRKEVVAAVPCHGFTLFPDGKMVLFRATTDEPTRVHPMQVWRTPFVSDEIAAIQPVGTSFLAKIGNAELVRGISDALSICRMVEDSQPSLRKYEDLIQATRRVSDNYLWYGDADAHDLRSPLHEIQSVADLIADEFEKVQVQRQATRQALNGVQADQARVLNELRPQDFRAIESFVETLATIRNLRGRIVGLRDLRYIDLPDVDTLEAANTAAFAMVSKETVTFLLKEEALTPYLSRISELTNSAEKSQTVVDLATQQEAVDKISQGLELLSEIVASLKVDDATKRTKILEKTSEVFSQLNRTRAICQTRRKELRSTEAKAEFSADFRLYAQSVQSAIGLADTPEKCDDQLAALLLQLEELESRYSEFDEFLTELAVKREDVYEVLSARKQTLVDERQRRSQNVVVAVDRILSGIARRSATFQSPDELNTYFAADPMVAKVYELSDKLRTLGDGLRADEIISRLKVTKEESVRALRDRSDLFEDGAKVIRLGRHRFSVNTSLVDLTLIPRDDKLVLHLTGTDYFEVIDEPQWTETKEFWAQQIVSETDQVYRSEYLASCILAEAESEQNGVSVRDLIEAARFFDSLSALVNKTAAERYDEGYERGVHDHDAALILAKIVPMYFGAGLLRYPATARAIGTLFWARCDNTTQKSNWERRAKNLLRLRETFAHSNAIDIFVEELSDAVLSFFSANEIKINSDISHLASRYLLEEVGQSPVRFVVSPEAIHLRDALAKKLNSQSVFRQLTDDLAGLSGHLRPAYELATAWVRSFVEQSNDPALSDYAHLCEETAVLLLTEPSLPRMAFTTTTPTVVDVSELLGQHPRIINRTMRLRLDEFVSRLTVFRKHRAPSFRHYVNSRNRFLQTQRARLRLDELKPKVMSTFVRNRLINDVYLPLIGDNLAKQIGTVGETGRTDRMGMLLLISPPGYGKTTLMEYVANRLGLIFVKVNGPSLGHGVTSIDPDEAPNMTARQEVDKVNFALELGNNVMLYIDDIQHTNTELLQKFISLCDAQRKIEGVWRGQARTYDLRGKRFCVCMAGNPYTESGQRFQLPDMLANRADTYNLGEVLSGRDELFRLSYVENSLTSNPVLAPLVTRDPQDISTFVAIAHGQNRSPSELKYSYSAAEQEEIVLVLRKLFRIIEVVLAVNQQYILSASQEDAYRTEPPFKLQGSYRNMTKLASKVVAVMNPSELESLIDDHYASESQTLTTGAEHNLLKLAEIRGKLTDEQNKRWAEIKKSFGRNQVMGGRDADPVTRVTQVLGSLGERLDAIALAVDSAVRSETANISPAEKINQGLTDMGIHLAAIAKAITNVEHNVAAQQQSSVTLQSALQPVEKNLTGIQRALQTLVSVSQSGADRSLTTASTIQPLIDQMTQLIATLAKARFGVEIVNMPPPAVHDLVSKQIQIIEQLMIPVLRSLGHNLKGSKAIWDKLGELIEKLRETDMRDIASAARTVEMVSLFGNEPNENDRNTNNG